ncbi:unnamed protein product [Urochloa humidicola]
MERFDKACKYTQAKMVGTVVCLVGAMAMSFLHSPSSSPKAAAAAAGGGSYYDWILGCSYLVAAAVILALVTVLQAATLASFPAPLTMCSITSAMGAAFTAILQVVVEGRFGMGLPKIDVTLIAGIVVIVGRRGGRVVHRVPGVVPEQEGSSVRVSVRAGADGVLGHPVRVSPAAEAQPGKPGGDRAHVQWPLRSPVGQEERDSHSR